MPSIQPEAAATGTRGGSANGGNHTQPKPVPRRSNNRGKKSLPKQHKHKPNKPADTAAPAEPEMDIDFDIEADAGISHGSSTSTATSGRHASHDNAQRAPEDKLDERDDLGNLDQSRASDGARLTNERPAPAYFLQRENDLVVPLIPADEIPIYLSIHGIPRTMTVAEAQTKFGEDVKIEPSLHPRSRTHYDVAYTEPSSAPEVDQNKEPDFDFGPSTADVSGEDAVHFVPTNGEWQERAGAYMEQLKHQWAQQGKIGGGQFGNVNNESGQVYNPMVPGVFGRKVFCSHWMRTGECDFTQQGCNYLHRMPDLVTMEALGMKQYPRWFRELGRQDQVEIATNFDRRGLDPPAGTSPRGMSTSSRRGNNRRENNSRPRRDDSRDEANKRRKHKNEHRVKINGPRPGMPPPPPPFSNANPGAGPVHYPAYPPNFTMPAQTTPPHGFSHGHNQPSRFANGSPRCYSPLMSEFSGPSRMQTPAPHHQQNYHENVNLMDDAASTISQWTRPPNSCMHIRGGAVNGHNDSDASEHNIVVVDNTGDANGNHTRSGSVVSAHSPGPRRDFNVASPYNRPARLPQLLSEVATYGDRSIPTPPHQKSMAHLYAAHQDARHGGVAAYEAAQQTPLPAPEDELEY